MNLDKRAEWLEWRKFGVGSSDVPAIMGVSPYNNILDIYLSKINPVEEKEPNYVMQIGNKLEPIARSHYELLMDADFPATNFSHASVSYLRVSLDGFNLELNRAIEIKYCGKSFTEICPEKYIPQIQYQYLVTNCNHIDLVQINNMNQINIIPVLRDNEYISRMLEKVDWFWACVVGRKEEEINEVFASENLLKRKTKKPRGSVRNVLG